MKPPSVRSIAPESLEGDDALLRLLESLNPFMGQVAQALTGQLTFGENFRAELKTLDVTVPEPAWIAPTLENSWVNHGGSDGVGGAWETAGYRIDPTGRVHLRGLVKDGDPDMAIFTLPVGYRPAQSIHLATVATNAYGTLQILTDGTVKHSTGTTDWFSLAFSFQATAPAPPAAFVGVDWPILFSTRVLEPRQVVPIQVQDPEGTSKTTFGGAALDWERVGDGRLKLKSVHGLTPSRAYKLTVLVTGG